MGTGMTDGELSQWIDAHMVQLGQSGIRISDGSVIYIDAFRKTEDMPRADFIFVTHEHGDHFNPEVIQALRGPDTHVVVPESMRETGKDGGLSTAGIRPGETATIGSLVVKAFPAYNLRKPMHARHKGHVGYHITLPGGITVYHAGDTDLVPEMKEVDADIALIPVGGLATMNWRDALEAMSAIGARVTIPIHYGIVPMSRQAARKFISRGGESVKELR